MNNSIRRVARFARPARFGIAATVLAMGLMAMGPGTAALADPSETDARLAISRAEAKIEMVSREYPAATQDLVFTRSRQKLTDANAALDRNKDRDAVWLAQQAELLADTAAGASKLAGLERTRNEVAKNVEILELELRKIQ